MTLSSLYLSVFLFFVCVAIKCKRCKYNVLLEKKQQLISIRQVFISEFEIHLVTQSSL